MYNETTRLVKVVMPVETEDDILQGETNPILASVNPMRAAESAGTPTDSGAIMLSDTAENLYIAYEVVAMVKDESTGKTHFSQLKWKKLGTVEDESESESEETEPQLVYEFMFESGDLFVAYAADEYPALDGDELQMLSDSSSGGGSGGSGGGGVNVVHGTVTEDNGVPIRCVLDKTVAEIAAMDDFVVAAEYESGRRVYGRPLTLTDTDLYIVGLSLMPKSPNAEDMFTFLSAADNPTWTASGGGPKE